MTKIIFFIQCVQVICFWYDLWNLMRGCLRCWLFDDACFFSFFRLRLRLFFKNWTSYFSWKRGWGLAQSQRNGLRGKIDFFLFFFFFLKVFLSLWKCTADEIRHYKVRKRKIRCNWAHCSIFINLWTFFSRKKKLKSLIIQIDQCHHNNHRNI